MLDGRHEQWGARIAVGDADGSLSLFRVLANHRLVNFGFVS